MVDLHFEESILPEEQEWQEELHEGEILEMEEVVECGVSGI